MTRTSSIRLCWLLPALGLLAALGSPLARGGVAVSPLKQEISVKPGEAGKAVISLSYNSHDEFALPQAVHISLADVQVMEDGALVFRDAGTMGNSANKWIVPSRTDLLLEPGKTQTVECAISLPQSAEPGEYYSAVLVTLANNGRNERGVIVEYRVASGIFLTVLGRTLPRQAKIARAEVIWPSALASTQPAAVTDPAATTQPAEAPLPKFAVLLQNTGSSRFDGSGKVSLVDERMRTVFAAPLATRRACVFAGDSRLFEAMLTKPLPAGKYTIKVEMDYQSSWAKVRHEIPVEVLPAEAELMLSLKKRMQEESPVAEVLPERLSPAIPAGATRSLALTLHNTGDEAIQCVASVSSADIPVADPWITLGPQEFGIARAGRKSVGVKIHVPDDAKAGKYVSIVSIEGGPEGSRSRRLEVPVEIEVITEK